MDAAANHFYLVTDPTEVDIIGDICCSGTALELGFLAKGSPDWSQEHPALHATRDAAVEDATRRICALHGVDKLPTACAGEPSDLCRKSDGKP